MRLIFILLIFIGESAAAAVTQREYPVHFEPMIRQVKSDILSDPHKAANDAGKIEKLARKIANYRERGLVISVAQRLEAEALLQTGDLDRADAKLQDAQQGAQAFLPKSNLMGEILLTSGGLRAARREMASALRSYQIAFKLFESFHDQRNQAISLIYIATLYNDARDNDSALRYYDQASGLSGLDANIRSTIENNRGYVFQDLGRPERAIEAFGRALTLLRRDGSNMLRARMWGNIARSRIAFGQIAQAQQALATGLRLTRLPGAEGERLELLSIMAEIALKQGRIAEAGHLVDRSFAGVDLATTTTPYRKMHDTAYRTYRALGRPDLAFAHLLALKRIDDEATRLAISTSTALMGARFDFANQELRIATLKADELRRSVAFEQARAHSQRLLFLGGAGATALVIVLLAIGLVTIRRSRNEVRAANIDLGETNAALGKALAAKTEFLATTSHEIRTPLNGILGMTQVMLADGTVPAALRDRLSIVQGAGLTMKALVDDILDVAKLETGNVTIEDIAFAPAATIRDAAGLWEEQARTKGLAFAIDLGDCPERVMGDPARLRQIVFNLLGNALKFTATGKIAVSSATDPAGQILSIVVADTGIGIPPEQQATIFEAFRQADAGTTRLYGGTGLGLAICRNLARAMGGDVTVASRAGAGATFTLTLPLRLATPADDPCAQVPDQPGGALLVVERNPIARGMWRGLLDAHAGSLTFAGSVGEAETMLACGGIGAMLVDDATVRHEPAIAPAVARLAGAAAAAAVPMTLLWAGGDLPVEAVGDDAQILAKPLSGAALVAALFTASADPGLVSQAA